MTDNPINIFDVSIGSQNTGDQIIMFYALKELDNLGILKKSPIHYYQTHSKLSFDQVKLLRKTNYSIVCGSNLLTGKQFKYRQWDIGLKEMIFLSNFVLFGVGWRSYESKVSIFTSKFYKNILSKKHIHSVRDSYSKEKLNSININNVINTGCPTTWNLSESFCKNIPSFKSDFVVFTLTDYRRDIKKDKKLIEILLNNYKKVFFWSQGVYDLAYLKSINNNDKISFINPNLDCFREFLSSNFKKLDYVGTRLHGGIMALNFKVRTIIIAVDNRAVEMGSDLKIPYVLRENIDEELHNKINSDFNTILSIKNREIEIWKSQFKEK
jgi:polysaccharide pyruvyl transferase WcaK-like protein